MSSQKEYLQRNQDCTWSPHLWILWISQESIVLHSWSTKKGVDVNGQFSVKREREISPQLRAVLLNQLSSVVLQFWFQMNSICIQSAKQTVSDVLYNLCSLSYSFRYLLFESGNRVTELHSHCQSHWLLWFVTSIIDGDTIWVSWFGMCCGSSG